jgi:hypothetical protein
VLACRLAQEHFPVPLDALAARAEVFAADEGHFTSLVPFASSMADHQD